MIAKGFDTAWTRPDYKKAYASGFRFACRYLAPLPNGKVITSAEVTTIHNAGLSILLNWENYARDAMRGWSGGVSDAKVALQQAKALGYPKGLPILFSVGDFDVQPSQFYTVGQYLGGVYSVLGADYTVGTYGGRGLLKWIKSSGKAQWYWQAAVSYAYYDNGGTGITRWPEAHLVQVKNGVPAGTGGGDCDIDEQQLPIPMWNPPGVPAPPSGDLLLGGSFR